MQTGNEHSICRERLHTSFNLREKQPAGNEQSGAMRCPLQELLGGQEPRQPAFPGSHLLLSCPSTARGGFLREPLDAHAQVLLSPPRANHSPSGLQGPLIPGHPGQRLHGPAMSTKGKDPHWAYGSLGDSNAPTQVCGHAAAAWGRWVWRMHSILHPFPPGDMRFSVLGCGHTTPNRTLDVHPC